MPASVRWFARPLATVITPVFYNLGFSANGVTLFRVILTAMAILCLALGGQVILYAAAVIGAFAFVLDFVDGHIARLDDRASYWGKYSDGLADYLFPAIGLFAAGVGLTINSGDILFVIVGGTISLLVLFTRTARDRLRYFQNWMIEQTGPLTDEARARARRWLRWEYHVSGVATNGRNVAFVLLLYPDNGLLFFYVLAFIQLTTETVWLFACLMNGYATLNRWRKSANAVN